MKLLFRILLLTVFGTAITQASAAYKVSASVNQNPVIAGQAFTLEVVADASLDVSKFDASSLLRAGFVVGSTSTSRNYENINGKSSQETRWITTLLVREAGSYLIPSLNVDGIETQPIQIEAIAMQTMTEDDPAVQMQINIEAETAYVGQALRYQMRLLVADQLEQANILAPNALGAKIEQLGEDERSTEVIQGRRYRVLSRYWLITPQTAGEISITSPHLSGVARTANNSVIAVELEEDPFVLDVKGIPENYDGTWLPSHDVAISESIEPEVLNISAGDGFVRQISITVAGLGVNQLPSLDQDYGADFRAYPEPPVDRTYVKDGVVLSKRVQRTTLIPNKSGNLVLPGISLPWWNTKLDQREIAQIDGRVIIVEPSQTVESIVSVAAQSTENGTHDLSEKPNSKWSWFFASAWIATLLAWLGLFLYKRRQLQGQGLKAQPELLQTTNQESPAQAIEDTNSDEFELFVSNKMATNNKVLSEKQLWQSFEESVEGQEPRQMLTCLDTWLERHPQAMDDIEPIRKVLQELIWNTDAKNNPRDDIRLLEEARKVRVLYISQQNKRSSLPELNGKIELGKEKGS
ncbi:protein BatD [Alginatibacterium sediminis]|uniref:Protein BatD n=1 Tax=Alginatibacterium sediminis TaxID=2164068 RepID=A0A420EG77_9ALTE|nr:BatD family protein [Alginatibacterium sediminis]RKF19670.1 protein BatD [Alginatibacterium sediminis]